MFTWTFTRPGYIDLHKDRKNHDHIASLCMDFVSGQDCHVKEKPYFMSEMQILLDVLNQDSR